MERDLLGLRREPERAIDIEAPAALIARAQLPSGEIPWCAGQKTDPWDHVEAAMALGIAGRRDAARAAFQWLAGAQLPDGSWYSAYLRGRTQDRTRDANLSAYVAVGVYHDYLLTGDGRFLAEMWETVRAAIDFALSLQAPQGEIHWAISPRGRVDRMALLTGSSSIFMSIKCALAIAAVLGRARGPGRALRGGPALGDPGRDLRAGADADGHGATGEGADRPRVDLRAALR